MDIFDVKTRIHSHIHKQSEPDITRVMQHNVSGIQFKKATTNEYDLSLVSLESQHVCPAKDNSHFSILLVWMLASTATISLPASLDASCDTLQPFSHMLRSPVYQIQSKWATNENTSVCSIKSRVHADIWSHLPINICR